jgi:hypothetical protein
VGVRARRLAPRPPDHRPGHRGTRAVGALPVVEVDLHGEPGIDLADPDASDVARAEAVQPDAVLLPALDPTAMGWKRRDWYFGMDRAPLFDTAGNIGPTIWWDGEVVGAWAMGLAGDVRTRIVADRGRDAADAVDAAASVLEARLGGTRVVPAIRTPLERELSG